jgi:glyoxylase-like metal-dependent hydrolase (beta-lactamase superfamily II)
MKLHLIKGYIQSIYLAEYPEKLLLLDGCCRADVKLVEDYICQVLNRPMSDLKLVIVSHMHPDHAGAAQVLRNRHSCLIASMNSARHWYHGWQGVCGHLIDLLLAYYVVKAHQQPFKNLWYKRKLVADHGLEDNQYLPGFDDWQVIYTPGHTDRDISLYHAKSKQVYVGDTILKVKGRFIVPFPICHPNQYKRSLIRLKELKVQKYLMAHGEISEINDNAFKQLQTAAPLQPRRYSYFIKRFFNLEK